LLYLVTFLLPLHLNQVLHVSDYNFENLDAKNFEQLANALCAEYVTRATLIFGSGTDGGREATCEGKMKYPLETKPWNGYLVVQCKHKEKLSRTLKQDADWAIAQLDAEMEMYKSAAVPRRRPQYFLFITNVELSARLKTGGKDRFMNRLAYWVKELKMKGADVWDRDKLGNLLDTNRQIAEGFGFLHAGDLIHRAVVALGPTTDTKAALYVFLHKEIRHDQFVNLAQAGHTSDAQPLLARVFVDLKALMRIERNKNRGINTVEYVQRRSDRSISPSALKRIQQEEEKATAEKIKAARPDRAQEIAEFQKWINPSRFVFIGGPGQGKSTLAQYLAQRHRAALLLDGQFGPCEPEVETMVLGVKNAADKLAVGLPKHPRLPFRIILEKLASALANNEVTSVLDYVASLVRARSGLPFTRRDAEQLLATMPWLVAFDGLDEVPAASNRAQVLDVVQSFLDEARYKNADLLVLATTRPQGFNEEFSPDNYTHLTLQPLSKKEALQYAQKLVNAKYPDWPDRRELVMERLRKAAEDEAIVRLMESPLQVTIMAVLVELVGNLPRERFVLFQRYYNIIYQREQERGLKISDVLVTHQKSIEIIHDRIGLKLQIESETKANAQSKTTQQGRLSRGELREMVHEYLMEVGFEEPELSDTTDDFMTITTERLVFMVQAEQDNYEFEVRSLQEFSAARALMRGEYQVVKERLRAIATTPYWLNTILFAVGRAFSLQNDQQCDIIVQLCSELNDEENGSVLHRTMAGSRLALDILEDGVGESRPKYRRQLLNIALQLVALPHEATANRLSALYQPAHDERYRMAAQAAIGAHHSEDKLGLFALLVDLAERKEEVQWAKEMLQHHWPKKLEAAQYLLERFVAHLTWEPWQVEVVQEVARQSEIYWVDKYLGGNTPVQWITAAQALEDDSEYRIELASAADFNFTYSALKPSKEVLEAIAEGQPIYPEWLPFVVCHDFLLQPSAETLADALEALVKHEAFDLNYKAYHHLPWQLTWVLNQDKSVEELLGYAQRARQGLMGSTNEWRAAEKRWKKHGFTAADFRVFSDAEWPFTAEIAQHGIQPSNALSVTSWSEPHKAAEAALLEAFTTTTSTRARPILANALFFVRRVTVTRRGAPTLPLATLMELAQAATRSATAPALLSFLEPDADVDWVGIVNELDAIGRRITWLGTMDVQLLAGRNISELAGRLVSFLPGKPIREGILRMLASMSTILQKVVGVSSLPVEFEKLSMQGKIDYVATVLHAEIPMPVDELTERVMHVWHHHSTTTRYAEIPRLLRDMLEQRKNTTYHTELFAALLAQPEVDLDLKDKIVSKLIDETQLRVSGLEDPETRSRLKLGF
jgi:hypothetical protein